MTGAIAIAREDPRQPDVTRLVHELDEMFHRLYPAKAIISLDVEHRWPSPIFISSWCAATARRWGRARCGAAIRTMAKIKRIYVRPQARGSRLGRAVLRRLEEDARRAGLALVRLETGIYQPEALGLFVAEGFVRCAAFADYSRARSLLDLHGKAPRLRPAAFLAQGFPND